MIRVSLVSPLFLCQWVPFLSSNSPPGGVVVTQDYLDTLNLGGDEHTSLLGTVTAIYDVGCFFGAILAFSLGEILGRKKTIFLGTTVMAIGAILQITAFSVAQMIVGRIVAGIGNGLNTATAPVWQAETSKAAWRGKLVVIEMICNIAGFSLKIQWAAQFERENGMSWIDLLKGKTGAGNTHTIRRLLLGAGTQAMQQLAGINVTSYYLPTVLTESVGLGNSLARLLAACNSVSYLLFSLIGIPNVEPWGRRKMMMYAAAGQCFCYLMITVLIRYNELPGYSGSKEVASASIAFFFLYYVFFGIGWQGVPWLYPTEINSLSMRTKGAALGTASNWAFNFMVVEITPIGIQSLQWRFYIIWTVFNASFVPIVYLFYPETADRTLEDIDRFFREEARVFVFLDRDAVREKRPLKYIEHEEREVRRNSSVLSETADPEVMRKRLASMARANEEGGWVGHEEKV
ncbi:MAG: hypothetical protein LQ343_003499 [Gyalolechia ehrenbergii]|nr:MAG: hypothetical protein LQ343_003499 [Gyalolechia ehrenbergii]